MTTVIGRRTGQICLPRVFSRKGSGKLPAAFYFEVRETKAFKAEIKVIKDHQRLNNRGEWYWVLYTHNQVRASKAHSRGRRATFALFRCNSPKIPITVCQRLVLLHPKSARAARFPRKCALLARTWVAALLLGLLYCTSVNLPICWSPRVVPD